MENTITLFLRALPGKSLSFAEVNKVALPLGYLVHPDCCTKAVLQWLHAQIMNPNSTFYKSWQDITSQSRMELAIDQILHYMTTYGTDFTAKPYVPNDEPEVIPYSTYKVILPISKEDLYARCLAMLQSGIALNPVTLNYLTEFIVPNTENPKDFPIDSIKNREALIYLCDRFDITPNDKFSLLRYISYKSTFGAPLLIQDKRTISMIKLYAQIGKVFDLSTLSEEQIKSLSSIFLRFKNIFLALKPYKNNASIVNKMRRLAVTTHTPMTPDFWSTLLQKLPSAQEITSRIHEIPTTRIISLLNGILERCKAEKRSYVIRNQKIWIKDSSQDSLSKYKEVISTLYKELIHRLSEKKCAVKFPKNLVLACPTSEKNFIGNLPAGSFFEIKDDALIGVYWRNEWGTHDFDLSFLDSAGKKYGWNARFNSDKIGDVIYSGDMTNADPEATEIIKVKNHEIRGIFHLNRYNGTDGSKYRFFYADEKVENLSRNYMVDPNSILVNVEMISDSQEQSLAILDKGRVSFMRFGTGNSRVSSTHATDFFEALSQKADCYLRLDKVLLDAGFWEATEEDENVLDLTNLSKDTILKLFTKEGE